MTDRKWLAAGVGALMLASAGVVGSAGGAQAADLVIEGDGQVRVISDNPRNHTMAFSGVSKRDPITISWGDGSESVIATSCSRARADRYPKKCRARADHTYTQSGEYTAIARRGNTVVKQDQVTVIAPSDPVAESVPEYEITAQWRARMIDRINQVRAENGAGPVGACPRLDQVAQDYAQLMADTGHYDHTGPGGESPWDRMRAGGYVWRSAGENIAQGYRDADRVQTAWEESAGHFSNMVNPNVNHVGLGAAQSPSGRWFWVQKYGSGGNCDLGGRQVGTEAPIKI